MAWTEEYRKEVASFLHTVKKHGGVVLEIFDGEEMVSPEDESPIETVLSVESSHVFVRKPDGGRTGFFVVLGNDPGELLADFTDNEWARSVFDEHVARWDKI